MDRTLTIGVAVIAATIAGQGVGAAATPNEYTYAPMGGRAAATVDSVSGIAALILPGGTVLRSKGVASVSHPSIGAYCIVPKKASVVAGMLVPTVSVDWSNSSGSELLAFYRSSGGGCPANNIAVLTYTSPGGTASLSDSVAFTIVAE